MYRFCSSFRVFAIGISTNLAPISEAGEGDTETEGEGCPSESA
jgi:hypothetical protein